VTLYYFLYYYIVLYLFIYFFLSLSQINSGFEIAVRSYFNLIEFKIFDNFNNYVINIIYFLAYHIIPDDIGIIYYTLYNIHI